MVHRINLLLFYFQDFCQAYREDRDLPFPESTTYIRDKIEDLGEKEKQEIINDLIIAAYNNAKNNLNNVLNIQSVESQYGFVRQPNLLNLNLTGLI